MKQRRQDREEEEKKVIGLNCCVCMTAVNYCDSILYRWLLNVRRLEGRRAKSLLKLNSSE